MSRYRGLIVIGGLLCIFLFAGGAVLSTAADAPLVGYGSGDTGAASDTTQVTFTVENTGSEEMVGVTLQLTQIPEGFSIADTGGDGAYGSQSQAFIYLTIGAGDSATSTITFRVNGCVGRGSYRIGADVVDRQSQTVDSTDAEVTITRNRDPDRQPLGPNGRRNCVVNASDPASFPRDCIEGESPAVVYADEQLNISGVVQSESQVPIGTESVLLTGIGGQAEGDARSVSDPTNVNFQSFEPGLYSTDDTGPDADPELIVQEPELRSLGIYTEPNRRGADVSGGQIVRGFPVVYVNPRYNFDQADRLEVNVRDTDGIEVTEEVLASSEDQFITRSSQDLKLDFSNSTTGVYEIGVEGTTMCPTATTTLNVTNNRLSVDSPSDPVTRGEFAPVNVTSQPQTTAHVRLPADRVLANPDSVTASQQRAVAKRVFTNAGDIEERFYDPQTDQYVATIGAIDDDGTSRIRLRTDSLRTGEVTIGAGPGREPTGPAADTVDIELTEAQVTLDQVPETVQAREDFTIRGQAQESDRAAVYVRIDDVWHRVSGPESSTSVIEDNYVMNLSATGPLAIPGRYPFAVVADAVVQDESFPETLSESQWDELDTSPPTLIRIAPLRLTATVSNPHLAAETSDTSRIQGHTVGERVRIYEVSPTGTTTTTVEAVQDGEFEHEFDTDTLGTHRLVIVAPGRDGEFAAVPPTIPASFSRKQAISRLLDAHSSAGSDDLILTKDILVTSPRITVNATRTQDSLRVSGETNRENETTVLIDVYNLPNDTRYLTSTHVSGGHFVVSIPTVGTNASGNETTPPSDTISLPDRSTNVTIILGDESRTVQVSAAHTNRTPTTSTPTRSPPNHSTPSAPTETPEPATTQTTTPTPTAGSTSPPTTATTTTSGQGSGLSFLIAILALVTVGLRRALSHQR